MIVMPLAAKEAVVFGLVLLTADASALLSARSAETRLSSGLSWHTEDGTWIGGRGVFGLLLLSNGSSGGDGAASGCTDWACVSRVGG